MDEKERDKAICKALSLESKSLIADWHRQKDETGNAVSRFWVHYIWTATISDFFYSSFTVGIARCNAKGINQHKEGKTPDFYKGIVLVDKYPDSFVGTDPVRSIELPDFNDTVFEQLQHINLAPEIEDFIPDDLIFALNLRIFLPVSYGSLEFNGSKIKDPNIKRLWDGIHETRRLISKAYNDHELNAFFDSRRMGGYPL